MNVFCDMQNTKSDAYVCMCLGKGVKGRESSNTDGNMQRKCKNT